MPRYLIDANLPRWFSQWNSPDYVHQHELDPTQHDALIWDYAKERGLTIITKDSDFSSRILISEPPPKVIHIRFGNMDMRSFHKAIVHCWDEVLLMNADHKLVIVHVDRLEGVR
jgi:predicted nuclease of predicted toxin-antitoxin system